jgi:hypothetical protein
MFMDRLFQVVLDPYIITKRHLLITLRFPLHQFATF